MIKKAILLINVGTPAQSDKKSVRRYLKEFLSDPRMIDIPAIFRSLLIHLFILPFRSKIVSRAYQKIWLDNGSPLLVNTKRMCEALAKELGEDYRVEFGMRYGHPNIESACYKLKNAHSLTVIPLYPQYSSAATGSAIEKCFDSLKTTWNIPTINIRQDFYENSHFIHAYAEMIKQHINNKHIDKIIFSYHGLPERHIRKSNCLANCDHLNKCPTVNDVNYYCYRAQCFKTTALIAEKLRLHSDQYLVSFQSRLGRTPWIKPYTDKILPDLIKKENIKNIAIVSPSFIVDCLETLEEINIRTRAKWQALGGNDFVFIPCLNDSPIWVEGMAEMIKNIN